MPKIKAVLLDLDGTLRDTKELIYSSIEHALKVQTGRTFTRDEMEPFIHHHQEVYRGLVGEKGLEDFNATYMARINKLIPQAKLFTGADVLIRRLHNDGYKLALVSTAITGPAYLRMHGLHEHFETMVGANDVAHIKPHPEPVLLALKKLKVAAEEAVMVGDMQADIEASKEAGVKTRVGITHGFGTAEQLKQAGATHVINGLEELPKLLEDLENET